MNADIEDIAKLAKLSAALDAMATQYPLSTWVGWHTDNTSQRKAIQLLAIYRTVIVLGGNRSGKTEMMRAVLVAMVLGSDHPVARLFWLHNGCNPDDFPKGPGRGYIIALTSNDSVRYHRKQIAKLLPAHGVRWWNKNSRGEARVEISIPGYAETAEIWFKSEDQGADAMQGDNCRAILHDEEGPTEDVWAEADVRLWDDNGWHLMSNTPTNGLSWVYDKWVQAKPDDVGVMWIHSMDNPYINKKKLLDLAKGNKALAAARLRGEYVTLEGAVYEFSRTHNTCEPFEIPRDWIRYRGIDFGTRNPFCCLWGALSPDGILYIYREHYQAQWTLKQHAEVIREMEGWEWDDKAQAWTAEDPEMFELSWADPEDPQQLMQCNEEHDLDVTPAIKAVLAGIDDVSTRLGKGPDGKHGLIVFNSCPKTINEFSGYVWADGSNKTDKPDRPKKKNDHGMDALRYMSVGITQSS